MISVFGWFLAIRGLLLLAAPQLIARVGAGAVAPVPLVRIGFGALFLVGLWLTFVGWIAKPIIVIGWAPPDITGVFKTATNFFEAAAQDGNKHGFNIQVITQSSASHTAFSDEVAIIEDYVERGRHRDIAHRGRGDRASPQRGQRQWNPGDHCQPAGADWRS